MTTLARLALAAAVSMGAPALASAKDTLPFVGTWDCEVATFTFTDKVYNNGSEDMPIEEIQEGTDGSYTLIFAGDYSIGLSGFTGDTMGWLSYEIGDSFTCKRLK